MARQITPHTAAVMNSYLYFLSIGLKVSLDFMMAPDPEYCRSRRLILQDSGLNCSARGPSEERGPTQSEMADQRLVRFGTNFFFFFFSSGGSTVS